MAWDTLVTTAITAGAAILGVGYGARLSRSGESLSWARGQRLKAYTELLGAIEKCYESFTLIAASLDLAGWDDSARKDPKVRGTITEWDQWMRKIDACLPQAELVASQRLLPYVMYMHFGIRSRQATLLMKLDYGQGIDQKEWEFVSSKTHSEILDIRWKFRNDITYVDPMPSRFAPLIRRFNMIRRQIVSRLAFGRSNESRTIQPVSESAESGLGTEPQPE